MNNLQIKISKLVPEAVIPSYSKPGDAGMDLVAVSKEYDKNGNVSYGTGLAFEIPDGYVGLLFPRSSNSKQDLILSNSVGVIDAGYRGEVSVKFKPSVRYKQISDKFFDTYVPSTPGSIFEDSADEQVREYAIGDRIGQIMIIPRPFVQFTEVPYEELTTTERGTGGYGSTGK